MLSIGMVNINPLPTRAEFVSQALKLDIPAVVTALRMPYGLAGFSEAKMYACAYSILDPSMRVLV